MRGAARLPVVSRSRVCWRWSAPSGALRARGRRGHRPARRHRLATRSRPRTSRTSSATTRSRSWSRATRQARADRGPRPLLALEGCLSGNAAGGQVFADEPAPAPCAELAETKPARVVYGPATFLNQFAIQAGTADRAVPGCDRPGAPGCGRRRQARPAAGPLEAEQQRGRGGGASSVLSGFQQQITSSRCATARPACRASTTRVSSVGRLRPGAARISRRRSFTYLFPSPESALISVRLRPDLTEAERRDAIDADPRRGRRPGVQAQAAATTWSAACRWSSRARRHALVEDLRPARGRARRSWRSSCWRSSGRRCGCCRWASRSAPRRSPSAARRCSAAR